jgi:hypothetical protein
VSPERETEIYNVKTPAYNPSEWKKGRRVNEFESDYVTFSFGSSDNNDSGDGSEDGKEDDVSFDDFVPIQYIARGGFGKVSH